MNLRPRVTQTASLKERLASFAKEARAKADLLPPAQERDDLLKKARRADTASQIEDWANSAGLQLPK